MAWIEKYKIDTQDSKANHWYVRIYKEGAAAGSISLLPAESPITFEFSNTSDDIFGALKEVKANLNVVIPSNFYLQSLYSYEDLTYKVTISHGDPSTLYWQGYVDTQTYEEPYEDVPNEVTIACNTGLTALSEIEFKDASGNYYNYRRLESQIILDILGKIGYTGFTEYINWFEKGMNSGAGESPMDQLYIDVDIFKDLYCDDVITKLLNKYNACMIQKNGQFIIYQPHYLADTSISGRIFTDVSTHTSTSYDPTQYLNRTVHTSSLQTVPGGVLSYQNPAKKITVTQDYGNKDSWIDNYDFPADQYGLGSDPSTYQYWPRSNSLLRVIPMTNLVTGEDGVALDHPTQSDRNISQYFGYYAVASASDQFVIDFDYGIYNASTNAIGNVNFGMRISQGAYGLSPSTGAGAATEAFWDNTSPPYFFFIIPAPAPGWSGWTNYRRTFKGLPQDGSIWVELPTVDQRPWAYSCFKDVKFYCTSFTTKTKQMKRKLFQRIKFSGQGGGEWQVSLRNKYYTTTYTEPKQNAVEDKYEPDVSALHGQNLTYDLIMGDVTDTNIMNIPEQFAGALTCASSGKQIITSSWHSPKDVSKNLLHLVGDEIAYQYNQPNQFFQLSLVELGPYDTSLNIIGNLMDDKDSLKPFAINRGTFDVRHKAWDLDLIEIKPRTSLNASITLMAGGSTLEASINYASIPAGWSIDLSVYGLAYGKAVKNCDVSTAYSTLNYYYGANYASWSPGPVVPIGACPPTRIKEASDGSYTQTIGITNASTGRVTFSGSTARTGPTSEVYSSGYLKIKGKVHGTGEDVSILYNRVDWDVSHNRTFSYENW